MISKYCGKRLKFQRRCKIFSCNAHFNTLSEYEFYCPKHRKLSPKKETKC